MIGKLVTLRLQVAAQRLLDRLSELEGRLPGDEAAWNEYRATAVALATLLPTLAPGHQGELLITKEMAAKLGVAPKTLLKRRAKGQVRPALQLGKRGRAALRWNGLEMPR